MGFLNGSRKYKITNTKLELFYQEFLKFPTKRKYV